MFAVHAAAVNMIEAIPAAMLEMMRLIAVEGMIAACVPEGAVIAPIAVHERAVIAIVIAVIIVVTRTAGGDPDPGGTGAAGQKDESSEGQNEIPHGKGLSKPNPLGGTTRNSHTGCNNLRLGNLLDGVNTLTAIMTC
jgi:hypothetical protein